MPSAYNSTIILKLFYHILSQPFPFWGIMILSLIGTLFSIYFGDEMVDVSSHKQRKKYHKHFNKYKVIILIFIITVTITLYRFLLEKLGVRIPL